MSDEFNDPASWDQASYWPDPCANSEPLPELPKGTEFKRACHELIRIFDLMDEHTCRTRDARMAWMHISFGLGLYSSRITTLSEAARRMECTKQAVSKGAVLFRRSANLPPAFGMKSEEACETYAKTNGRKRATSAEPGVGDFPAA